MRHLALGLALLGLLACDGAPTGDDGGPDDPRDAGPRLDGGADPDDAGRPRDGGIEPDGGPAGPNVDRTDPQLHEHALDPASLDPTVTDSLEVQYAQLDTRAEPLGRLVFFLAGANNPPGAWRNHGRELAAMGFHVVIPHYDNRWGSACAGMGGSCGADTRWEALTGEDASAVVDIGRQDSAEGRVLRMLEHLVTAHPGGDWGYYLDEGGGLRFDRVIIAGISHGATSAGLYGSRRAFERVVMHSGGYGGVGDAPATPIEAYWALSHTEDPQHAAHLASWESAAVPGAPTSIDGATPPYGGAHRLITSAPSSYPHCSVAVHSSTPVDAGGAYAFDAAWRLMYGAP